jgi:hypothetical protein
MNPLSHKKSDFFAFAGRISDFFIFGNIWIGLCSAIFYWATVKIIHGEIFLSSGQIFIAFSVVFVYNYLRFKSANHVAFRHSPLAIWIKNNYRIVKILMFLSALGSIVSFAFLALNNIYLMYLTGAIVVFGFVYLYFRSHWFFKILLIPFVWSLAVTLFPIVEAGKSISGSYFLICSHFFLLLGLYLAFEIRDCKYDEPDGKIQTFVMKFGVAATKITSLIFLLTALYFSFLFFNEIKLSAVLTNATGALLVLLSNEKRSEYFYSFLLDGVMFLYGILIIILH